MDNVFVLFESNFAIVTQHEVDKKFQKNIELIYNFNQIESLKQLFVYFNL